MTHRLYHGDCMTVMPDHLEIDSFKCLFADPPDNINLKYGQYKDRKPNDRYVAWLKDFVYRSVWYANVCWISFNAKWTFAMGSIVADLMRESKDYFIAKPCVQTFTFGQHSHTDLGNNHRPLWRIMRHDAELYPEHIRVPSWRQVNGDKRADPRGRVPGDVFDFPRVTGNSKQRRRWHPTQLNEALVERCILMSTKPGDPVLDPFGGTGTTLRVCRKLQRPCTLIEFDEGYCKKIADEHNLKKRKNWWS